MDALEVNKSTDYATTKDSTADVEVEKVQEVKVDPKAEVKAEATVDSSYTAQANNLMNKLSGYLGMKWSA